MISADLHIHSRYSLDGEFGVEELLRQCKEAHLEIISIADHNQVKAVPEGLEYGRKYGITLIPGIEIDCQYKGIDLHVLGYQINAESSDFEALEKDFTARVMESFPKMVNKLSATGIQVDLDEVLTKAGGHLPSGELVAEVLLGNDKYLGIEKLDPYRKGGSRSDMPYINFYLDFFAQGKPAYVKIEFMEYHEAIALIKDNHGSPVVAHPGLNLKGREEKVEELLDHGAEGLEVFNNYHDHDQMDYFARAALRRNVLMTCGSDFHGKTKPLIKPGMYRTIQEYEENVAESIERLRNRSV
ncbi:MAG: PHP domain-containing protein [Bacteroidales bacterium]|nr:PHP domain-containing protein [Bacteroidales bacterium]